MNQSGFRPAWWLPGPHAQTLGARWLRPRTGEAALRRERVPLPDGDFLDLDFADGDPRSPLVVVLHGLEGSACSTYALEMYRALRAREMQAVGLNFRSCSGDLNRTPRLYHSGETGDLAHMLGLLRERFPGRRMGAVGFSLGGNAANPMLRAEFTEAGGHVGFVAGPPWRPVFWAEQRAAAFLAEQLGSSS